MFQFVKDPKIDFMSRRRGFLILSGILVLGGMLVLVGKPLLGIPWVNLGIEFTGGTEMQVKYSHRPDLGAIRSGLQAAGLGTPVVTTIGDESLNEVYIRLGTRLDGEETDGDLTLQIIDVLRPDTDKERLASGLTNLNEANAVTLRRILATVEGVSPELSESTAEAIIERRRNRAIFTSFEDLDALAGVTPAIRETLESRTFLGDFALRSQSYIGPAIGQELLNKAMFAILGSLAGVLIYIAFRFQLQWGVAALFALAHDTVVTLALFSVFRQEMSLPVVAAFLTLIGYSVNDTVVVFDRIRENLKKRGSQRLYNVVNRSLNQTLSRTLITSGLTFIVVLGLWLFGGQALRPFAFVLTVGVLVGTYSSICIASPILVLWKEAILRRKGVPVPSGNGGGPAKKARSTTA